MVRGLQEAEGQVTCLKAAKSPITASAPPVRARHDLQPRHLPHRLNHLMKQRGTLEAEIEAAQRADELLAAGDMDGRGVWLRVVEAVRELSKAGPAGTVH